jgi:single-stranded DNA-binding protein
MTNLNHIYLVGQSVESVKKTQYDDKIKYFFVLAVNYYSIKKKQEFADFIPIAYWRNKPYPGLDELNKGDTVIVNGRLSLSPYEKEGIKRVGIEVVANFIRVFPRVQPSTDMDDFLAIIKSNRSLIETIHASCGTELSESMREKLALSGMHDALE